MLKIAVIGAQTLLGRELVAVLEAKEVSVLPLAAGALTPAQEEGDLVMFAPSPALLEGLDLVILTETPAQAGMLDLFRGRVLDLREDANLGLEPWPLVGPWPAAQRCLRGRAALEQVLALLPTLVEGFQEVSCTHLRSVAYLGEKGLEGLMDQTVAVLKGNEPDTEVLGYRAAFEVVPQLARGALIEVRVPVFHGDLLIAHLKADAQGALKVGSVPQGMAWVETPPSSRAVAVSPNALAHLALSQEARQGVLTLGFDPILWGTIRPILRLLEL